FNNALINNHIKQFICQVDPTNMMNYSWVEKCENFLEDTEKNIWIPFAYDPLGWTLQEIQLFAQTLNGYINYLGVQMRAQPIGHVETFVPRFRDENPAWELQFSKNVEHYRHELIKIYEDIYKHMPFFIPDSSQ
ncbi:MAG TPA: hypothetical protein DCZ91_16890, partial [Lachnospiraceae bacterium]|nr:hypothetical protein [Lachnospiraceae bacterium]